ncbi:Hypothetical protein A7982_10416 [Minicystis rosea]|nr:Hypothetical protein A7982_10416 [Minicystis rosea]
MLPDTPNLVAELRPLAIVVTQEVYDFDPLEFDALARDVSSSLLRVEEDISEAMLELLLGAAIDASLARRREQGGLFLGMNENPSGRTTVPVRRHSWMDLEAPPSSAGPGRA